MQKGIPIPLDKLQALWQRAYRYGEYWIVIPEDYIITENALRIVYNERSAAIVVVGDATAGVVPHTMDGMEDEWEKIYQALNEGCVLRIAGPIRASVAALSNKKAVIRIAGKGGEIAVWQEATSRKSGYLRGQHWGIEARLGTYKWAGKSELGEAIKLQKTIQWYKEMAAMLKVL